MTRKEYNKKLLKELERFMEIAPDQRFGQIIFNFFFPEYLKKDPFFEEPWDTLKRVEDMKEKYGIK